MSNFYILPLNEDHSKEIFMLQKKNLRDFGSNIWRTEELANSIKKSVFQGYIFSSNKKINGFCFFKEIDDFIEIYSIFVVPKYRKKGVAKNFLECCLKYCKKNKLKKIILDVNETNLKAIKFYKKHNFIFCGRRKNYYRNEETFNDSFTMFRII
tara:strand:+ start:94 stop:555 length:462 start_codon:yes stop_codon:yes gene_type:complete